MNILNVYSFIAARCGAVVHFLSKTKQYSLLLIGSGILLFGLGGLTPLHEVAYGVGLAVLLGLLVVKQKSDS